MDFRDFPDPPFFIVGVARSGTTLLRLMLNAHPRLAIPFESGFITHIHERLDRYGDLREKQNCRRILNDIGEVHVAKLGRLVEDVEAILSQPITCYRDLVSAIFAAHAIKKGKVRWGDKTPEYIEHIEILATLFPSSLILHVIRDGRDVAVSRRRVGWFAQSIPYLAKAWKWQTVTASRMGILLGPERYREVRFEDLVRSPETALRAVCDFLGEEYDARMLEFTATASEEMPPHSEHWHGKSISSPDASKVYEWKRKMSRTDRILYEKYARGALIRFGYEIENHPMTLASRLKELSYLLFNRW